MNILHVVPTYYPAMRYGGPIHSIRGLCKALVDAGHGISVFTTSVDGNSDLSVPLCKGQDIDGVRVHYYPTSKILRKIYFSGPMRDSLSADITKFDILHIHSLFSWPTWAASRIAKASGIPYVISPRGMLVRDLIAMRGRLRKRAWISLIDRLTLEGAAAIHATSALEADNIMDFGFRLPNICIIPNGISQVDIEGKKNIKRNTLLYLGRISWKKGIHRLVLAMRWLPDVNLIIAGNDEGGVKEQVEGIALSAGVLSRVRFIGAISGVEKYKVLSEASLLVLPSYNENFGNVVLESLASGRPVAVTAGVGLAEEIVAAGVGKIISDDSFAMAQDIQKMLSEPEKLDHMGRIGRDWVRDKYGWRGIADRFTRLYESTANAGQRR